jgi:chloramphenicol O-acetyltransferase
MSTPMKELVVTIPKRKLPFIRTVVFRVALQRTAGGVNEFEYPQENGEVALYDIRLRVRRNRNGTDTYLGYSIQSSVDTTNYVLSLP